MMPSSFSPTLRRVAAVALLFTAGLAHAQFVWVDPKGVRNHSDQPPPPGTPPSRILKAPGLPSAAVVQPTFATVASAPVAPAGAAKPGVPATTPVEPGAPADPAAAKQKAKGPQTLAEKEADYVKRQKEAQEAEQKAQQQAKADAAKAENCAEARRSKQIYDSGVRISDVGPDGQKRYLSDAERAQRGARANAIAADCR